MFGLCRPSPPAATDCRTFVDPVLQVYYDNKSGIKNPPYDDRIMENVWGAPTPPITADSYRYDSFANKLAETLIESGNKYEKQQPKDNSEKSPVKEEFCSLDGSAGGCGSGCSDGICSIDDSGDLLSIMDPRFNMREAAKHMILLEDHLFQPGRRCKDCCCKHLLTIEAFLDEGITLDKKFAYYNTIINVQKEFKKFGKDLCSKVKMGKLTDEDCCRLAQELRQIRKPLCQNYATFF